ncbi:MAG TPA: efflux RND transporter periplasmic adaptor subunit, partial [Aggregicoccus sp.]|nr:efflux RND transporter periplasmic adaptor subunit [Aggregicoccus sp.]
MRDALRAARVATLMLVLAGAACKGEPPAQPPAPAPVVLGPENVARAGRRLLQAGPTLSGTLRAREEATVRAQVGGPVQHTFAEQGQRVEEGALLARLAAPELGQAVQAARTGIHTARHALEVAEADLARSEQLARSGVIPPRDLDRARLARAQAQAQLAQAQSALSAASEQSARTLVRAPFDGVVSERHARTGDIVQPGSPLFTVVDPSSLRLEASVPAEALSRLEVGTAVSFTVTGYAGRTFRGRIERINPVVDPATGQVRIYAAVPNAGGDLLSGLYAQGRVVTEQREVLAAPVGAVDLRTSPPSVLRVAGQGPSGKVERVSVQLGLRDEAAEQVELRSGARDGDL